MEGEGEKKKYGLEVRIQLVQPKKEQLRRPSLVRPPGFFTDHDNDIDVNREIAHQQTVNRTLMAIEEQKRKAIEEDPSVFDYDGVYERMKDSNVRPLAEDHQQKEPKYIHNLMGKAKGRKLEQEMAFERKLSKERSKEDQLFADKEKFITGAYRKKLAEWEKWLEEERIRQCREEKESVTRKDMSDFYLNLGRNNAFGAKVTGKDKGSERDHVFEIDSEDAKYEGSEGVLELLVDTKEQAADRVQTIEESGDMRTFTLADHTKRDNGKRSEDALAAARNRFLARKRMKTQ